MQIGILHYLFTIRLYGQSRYGYRELGYKRYAIDCWRIGFIYEIFYSGN